VPVTEGHRPLRLTEPNGRWSVLELPPHGRALMLAAAGLLVGCPDTDGKRRAIERLQEGDALLAVQILKEAFGGDLQR
jgi:hypothetical protein